MNNRSTLAPVNWRGARLGDVCVQDRRIVEPRSNEAKSRRYLSLEHVESGTGRILNAPISSPDDQGISTTFAFDDRHVLYGKLRPYLNKVALPTFSGRCTTEIIPLLPVDGIDRHFLAWLLRLPQTVSYAMAEKTGSRMPRADMNHLMGMQIRLPSEREQKRIAAVLNEQMAAVEKARAAAEAQGSELRRYVTNLLAESLSKVRSVRIGLAECLIETNRGVGETWSSYPVLGATREGLAPAKESVGKNPERYKLVEEGTIFYNPMRILLGSIAMIDRGDPVGITSPDYVVFKTDSRKLHHRWFYHWLRSPFGEQFIKSLTRGAVRERMLFRRLSDTSVEIPSIEAQQRVADALLVVRSAVQKIDETLAASELLPAAFLRRAFSGGL